jgi:hypothetical protein
VAAVLFTLASRLRQRPVAFYALAASFRNVSVIVTANDSGGICRYG